MFISLSLTPRQHKYNFLGLGQRTEEAPEAEAIPLPVLQTTEYKFPAAPQSLNGGAHSENDMASTGNGGVNGKTNVGNEITNANNEFNNSNGVVSSSNIGVTGNGNISNGNAPANNSNAECEEVSGVICNNQDVADVVVSNSVVRADSSTMPEQSTIVTIQPAETSAETPAVAPAVTPASVASSMQSVANTSERTNSCTETSEL